jgi:hypothetical protein
MIESVSDYNNFLHEVGEHGNPIILMAIPTDEYVHPAIADVSVVIIRDPTTKKTHCISFHHQDAEIVVRLPQFVTDMNKLLNKKFAFDKKSTIQMMEIWNLLDLNLLYHITCGKLIDKQKFDTLTHRIIHRTNGDFRNLNNVVPLVKHQETFDNMCSEVLADVDINAQLDVGYLKENTVILDTLAEIESNGVHVNAECFGKHFNAPIFADSKVYSQYNIYTATGRPSNHFDNVNYAALNKENGSRKCFVSRHRSDGKMVLVDYSAFHPRIICHLIKFPLAIDVDIYEYLGEMYLNRKPSEYDMDEIKKWTFRQLYGGVQSEYEHIKYFGQLKEFINRNWTEFQKRGYILTPIFQRPILASHIVDPNPNKLFNYILQATETELAIPALNAVNQYLRPKHTKAILYTYDSILFDFYKGDGGQTLTDIITIMKMGDRFPVKAYMGDSYDSVGQIYP